MVKPGYIGVRGTAHNEQVRAICFPDRAQMGCAKTTCLLTSCIATDAATACEWTCEEWRALPIVTVIYTVKRLFIQRDAIVIPSHLCKSE